MQTISAKGLSIGGLYLSLSPPFSSQESRIANFIGFSRTLRSRHLATVRAGPSGEFEFSFATSTHQPTHTQQWSASKHRSRTEHTYTCQHRIRGKLKPATPPPPPPLVQDPLPLKRFPLSGPSPAVTNVLGVGRVSHPKHTQAFPVLGRQVALLARAIELHLPKLQLQVIVYYHCKLTVPFRICEQALTEDSPPPTQHVTTPHLCGFAP